jgi:hypothetical protein
MGYGYPVLPPDPQAAWEEEQKKREREMMEALRIAENQSMPTPDPLEEPVPKSEYLDEYAEHVRNMPRVEEHSPSTLRKVLAAIAGTVTGSPDLARTISWNKYDTEMGEWGARKKALGEVADIGEESRRTDVTELGQRRSMEEGRRGRDFQRSESTLDRESRRGEAEAGRTFTGEEARKRREFESEEGKKDRAVRERQVSAQEKYYQRMGDRETQLTPAQQLDNLRLAAFTVAQNNPDFERFLDEKGMPIMDYSFWNRDATDEAAYAEFIKLVHEEADRLYEEGMRKSRKDVSPAGGQ